jgi:deazaflavin-dependent oxidoreductase (nitroreductase family)
MDKRSIARAFFRIINRYIIIPAFQIGLGWLVSNRLTGDIMIIGTVGRRTGKMRYTPVSYARIRGRIYCYQGQVTKGQWYLNLLENPEVEILLPEGRFFGRGLLVDDAFERLAALRELLKSSGLFNSMYVFNPATVADEVLEKKTKGIPVIGIAL